MLQKIKKVALITGASSGIGRATYLELIKNGWVVYGTSRKIEKNLAKRVDGGNMIYLDVNKIESIKQAISYIKEHEKRLDALINNAGFGIAGSIEDTSHTEAKILFDTNFFGTLSTIRSAVNLLREAHGIIINISSVAGILYIPFQGIYSASKAAMEAISESLRMELAPDDVRVCLIEPGDTQTDFAGNRKWVKKAVGSRYESRLKASIDKMEKDELNGASPEKAAKLIYKMIHKKNPPVRRAVGFSYQLLLFLRRFFPDRVIVWILGKMYA